MSFTLVASTAIGLPFFANDALADQASSQSTGPAPSAGPARRVVVLPRSNLIPNGSVETNTDGWSTYSSDPAVDIAFSRDPSLGSHGAASLRQDVSAAQAVSPNSAAYWIYPLPVDMSLWGRQVSAAMDARTSISDISPLLVLEFWRDNHLLDVTAEEVGSNSQPLTRGIATISMASQSPMAPPKFA